MIKTVTRVDHGRCKLQKSLLLTHLDPIFSRISVQLKFSLDFTGAVLLIRLLDNTVEEFVTLAKVRNCWMLLTISLENKRCYYRKSSAFKYGQRVVNLDKMSVTRYQLFTSWGALNIIFMEVCVYACNRHYYSSRMKHGVKSSIYFQSIIFLLFLAPPALPTLGLQLSKGHDCSQGKTDCISVAFGNKLLLKNWILTSNGLTL